MRRMEEFKLPKLFTVSGYMVYFWSNEEGEPIHVHISKGKPSPNNGSKIPNKELHELMEFISAQFFLICSKWKQFFVTDTIKFYC